MRVIVMNTIINLVCEENRRSNNNLIEKKIKRISKNIAEKRCAKKMTEKDEKNEREKIGQTYYEKVTGKFMTG